MENFVSFTRRGLFDFNSKKIEVIKSVINLEEQRD